MLRERKVRRGVGDTARSSSDSSRRFEIKAEGEAWLESHNLPAAMPSSCDIVFLCLRLRQRSTATSLLLWE